MDQPPDRVSPGSANDEFPSTVHSHDSAPPSGQPSPSAQEETARLGPIQRLTGVIFSPGETFKDISRKPTWLTPLLILMVISGGFFAFYQIAVNPDWKAITREQMRRQQGGQTREMPEEQMEIAVKFSQYFTAAGFLVGPAIYSLLLSGVFALGLMLMQAQTTFKKILAVIAWSRVGVDLIHTIVLIA
jgi:hypothetical protein